MRPENIEINILPKTKLEEIRRFLLWTYCVIEGWNIASADPAGLRTDGDRLIDERDHLCVHIIASIDGRLAGCVRICHRQNGSFKSQLYDYINPTDGYRPFDAEIS